MLMAGYLVCDVITNIEPYKQKRYTILYLCIVSHFILTYNQTQTHTYAYARTVQFNYLAPCVQEHKPPACGSVTRS